MRRILSILPILIATAAIVTPAFFEGDGDADFAFDQAEQTADQAAVAEEAPRSPPSLPSAAATVSSATAVPTPSKPPNDA